MRYLRFDKLQSRMAYLRYIALRTGGQVKGDCIFYDDKAGHKKAIDLIMDDELYVFSNRHENNEMPKLVLLDLNWSRDGLLVLFDELTKIDCLIIQHVTHIKDAVMVEQDELLRQIIKL